MAVNPNKVIYLHQRDPSAALERLNRITGLTFSQWPQSLVGCDAALEPLAECTTGDDTLQVAHHGPAGEMRSR
ncbi:hypothetical protein [Pseudomonas sp. Ga0074129]|uniref:hypothetical protein n=1 Tax=Pseudomonas sp. Ga0074129 TaxID=1752219 RepID=UPI0025DE80CB|nr:hypothetical protein [Pseudomonas sp. Ga0074129]